MCNSNNQALTCFDHKHCTEVEWALWMDVISWQSSTHFLWSQMWHRNRMSTMDACEILTIKHSLAVITNMVQKQNEHHRILTIKHSLALIRNMAEKQNEHHACMWHSDNQALTFCDHKHCTETEWALWVHVISWQSSTHFLWSQSLQRNRMSTMDACGILKTKHVLPVITNMAQKQHEYCGWMWNSDNLVLTYCDHKHGTEVEWAHWGCGNLTIKYSPTMITNMA